MSDKKIVKKSIPVAGRTLSFETGRLANRATSSVLAQYGETVVLATVTLGPEDLKKDYFPLSVEYQERLYAGGRIRGSRWVKREGRATDAEILSGRLTDRSVRPLFPKDFRNEVQIILTVLAIDQKNDADVLALNAASAALSISSIPWNGPVAAVRMGLLNEELTINPENGNRQGTCLDLVVASSSELITMIEAGASQVPEDKIAQALQIALHQNQSINSLITELAAEVGMEKLPVTKRDLPADLAHQVKDLIQEAIGEFMNPASAQSILEKERAFAFAKDLVVAKFDPQDQPLVKEIIENLFSQEFRHRVLSQNLRPDGRAADQLRPVSVEVGVLPRVHGSALFQRGETQSLTVTTLGAPSLYQSLESAEGEEQKRYMHHYNFPPFSTGETGKLGLPSRREIGHGALAERAIAPVIPPESDFPYAIRVVSEILSSNGSTSMASTCGSCLSLMDAGVPITDPVAGISIGLITPTGYPRETSGYCLLTDINGTEDHYGDMDFKVAGTRAGITAIQLDVKVPGLTLEICQQTLARAQQARSQLLDIMLKALAQPRPQLSVYAPQIKVTQIPVEKIGELIGPGGKNIKKLMADTDTQIDTRDDGSVFITGNSAAGVQQAVNFVNSLNLAVEIGQTYSGKVVSLMPYGAFVNILPGKDGLLHVSQMSPGFTSDPGRVVSVGDTVKVWVTEIDSQGRINLSMMFDKSGQPLGKLSSTPDQPHRTRRNQDSNASDRGHFSAPQRKSDRERNQRRRF